MKREIRFKGRTKQGKWLFGNLVTSEHGKVAIVPPLSHSMNNDHSQYEVKRDTVCQFTGCTDADGIDIYEGDILMMLLSGDAGDTYPVRITVSYEEDEAMFKAAAGDNKLPLNFFLSIGKFYVIENKYDHA